MHAGLGEAGEGGVRLLGVVDGAGHRPPARCSPRAGRPSPSGRLRAERAESSRSAIVQATQWLFAWPAITTASNASNSSISARSARAMGSPSGPSVTSGPEHRVVLGQRRVALHLEVGLRPPRDPVEEDRLLHSRDQRVADAAEQGVVRPDRQAVLAARVERAHVVEQVPLGVLGLEPERLGDGRVGPPAPGLDVGGVDQRVRLRMLGRLSSTSQTAWKICIAWCVSRVGDHLRDRVRGSGR